MALTLSQYGQYLASKKSVDDRSLNAGVLTWVIAQLQRTAAAPTRVLEIGAGLGTMPARLHELGGLRHAEYTLLDSEAQLLSEAREWLTEWATSRGLASRRDGEALVVTGHDTALTLRFRHCEVESYLSDARSREACDVVIGNAVLDLVDVPVTLPQLLGLLAPGGTYWFSVNFDGETIFLPEHRYDEHLMRVYHRSMDERMHAKHPAGDSKTGRRLFAHLRAAGARIAQAGSSDWVVFADDGRYPADEREFVRHILRTVNEELQRHADVQREQLAEWVTARTAQLENAELVYIAHQLDFAGTFAGTNQG
jgi:SAM-dependent methyltransferase